MSIEVQLASEHDEEAWETFVLSQDRATFFHRFPWSRVLARAFGHTPHYLLARRGAEVRGVLPLAEVHSRLFGHRLSSLPFAVYGGILAADDEAEQALRTAACDLAERLRVGSLELRNREASMSAWPRKELYFTFRKPISGDHGENLKAIPNRQRAMLRKALKEGLYSEPTVDTARAYRVYAESVRNLGTPVFSKRYFDALQQEFPDDCRMLMICQTADGQPVDASDDTALCTGPGSAPSGGGDVAAVLSFYFRGEVLPYYGGSVTQARTIKGCNHILYWELMRRSANEGIRSFDFGRSKADSGPFSFKKNFGFEAAPLPYEYHLVTDESVPDINPNNPRYQRLIALWQRLPLPLANVLGPPLARSLG